MLKIVVRFWNNHGGLATLVAVLAASLTLNVVFSWQLAGRPAAPRLAGIKLKSRLPTIIATKLDGSPVTIDFRSGRPTVVYVMSSHCGWCQRNYANIVALANSAMPRYRFVGLAVNGTLDHLRASLSTKALPFDVFLVEQTKVGDQPFLRATPTTLVVSPEGLIEQSWVGAYDASNLAAVGAFFSVGLPGLLANANPATASSSTADDHRATSNSR
jgi:hypothetical protein